jgi:tetratricopeptide (TPR) repeat protein
MADRGGCSWFSVAGMILLTMLAAQGRGPAAAAVLGKDPVAETGVARSPGETLRMLEEALPRSSGRLLLISQYPYMSALILPLKEKGILKELVVVLPSEKSLGANALDEIRLSLSDEGVSPTDLGTFLFDNGVIRGKLGEIPCSLSALPGIPGDPHPYTVAIDTFFLMGIYRSEASMPMVDLAGKLIATLRSRKVDASSVVLLDATSRAGFPLEHADLAMLLREMVVSPKDFDGTLPDKWRMRKRADLLHFFLQTEEASDLYRKWLAIEPRDASASYRLALLAAWDLDVDRSLHWMDKAASADTAFRRGYLGIARVFEEKRRAEAAERILWSGLAKFPKDALLSTALAEYFVGAGDSASSKGARGEAEKYYRKAANLEGADPGVREDAKSRLNPVPPLRGGADAGGANP